MRFSCRDKTYYLNESNLFTLLLIFVCVLIALVPMIFYRDFTPSNELRYLSIADESLATGRWWAFTNHGQPYADKPPLYLWCIMLGKWLFGCHIMVFYSFFSIIPAFVIGGIMYSWTKSNLDDEYYGRFPIAGILMLFSCGLFAGMMFTLRMDMMMTMFIVLALHRFRKLEHSVTNPALWQRLLFALWIFLAVFSKGPMGILIPLVSTTLWLMMTRRMKLWTRAWGWPTWALLLILCAGWFGAVYSEGGSEYLDNLLVHQTVGRAVNSFHHKRPFWYYLVSLTYTLLPWTLIIFGAIVYSVRKWKLKHIEDTLANYFLVIILSSFVLLSAISSKLQVYMLPAYPFMVYLAVMVCSQFPESRLAASGVAIPAGVLGVIGLGVLALTFIYSCTDVPIRKEILQYDQYLLCIWTILGAIVLVGGSAVTFIMLYIKRLLADAICVLSVTVLLLVFVAGLAVEDFNAEIGYAELSNTAVDRYINMPNAEIMTWRLDRPENMDVYLKYFPFRVVEAPDSISKMPMPSLPAIVMTERKHVGEIPYVRGMYHVGHRYVVVVCDTIPPGNLFNVLDDSDPRRFFCPR